MISGDNSLKRMLLVVAALALTLTACSDKTTGEPSAASPGSEPASTTTTKKNGTSPTSTSDTSSPLAAVKPCDLLDSAAMSTLGITKPGQEDKIGKARGCQWRVDRASIADSYTFDIALFESLGIADVVGDGNPKPLTVGSRKAVQTLRGQNQGCAISIEVTAKSRVDVQAAGSDGQKLCAPVLEAAKLVEPELP